MIKTPIITEFKEEGRFRDFLVRTRRLQKIAELEKQGHTRKENCIHILENFSSTATTDHIKKTTHLKRIDKAYKSF